MKMIETCVKLETNQRQACICKNYKSKSLLVILLNISALFVVIQKYFMKMKPNISFPIYQINHNLLAMKSIILNFLLFIFKISPDIFFAYKIIPF